MHLRLWRMSRTATILGLAVAVLSTRTTADELKTNAKAVAESEARLKRDVTYLASDELEGRGPTTKGLVLAGDYVANEFKKAGLKPGGVDGSYFQPFKVMGAKLDAPARFVLKSPAGVEFKFSPGAFSALGISGGGQAKAELVFAGYGITADFNVPKTPKPKDDSAMGDVKPKPEDKFDKFHYDEYESIDAAGKIVVVLRDVPRTANRFAVDPSWKARNGSLQQKIQNAEKHQAAAIIIVNDQGMVADGDDLMDFNFHAMVSSSAKIPAFTIHRSLLQSMLQSRNEDLTSIEQDIDRTMKPHSMALAGWTADLEAKVSRSNEMLPLRNVIGYLEGRGPLADEIVVVGAHMDHVGYGGFGSRIGAKKPIIHHGADDNGSGTTAVMELARRFAAMPNREGRKMVFMTFSGEELGLLGSRYFCEHPLFELKDVAAMVNLDMVGRMSQDPETKRGKLLVEGTGSAKLWDSLVEQVNAKYEFKIAKTPAIIPYSDHASFYSKKVPVLFFWTGYHPDYHGPTDTSEKINVPDMRRIVDMTEETLLFLSTSKDRPEYVQVKQQSPARVGGAGNIPRLGFAPAYGEEGEGVLVDAVTDGGPASKAGIKKGDRIVEIAGKPVKNLEAYMSAMGAHKAGETIEVTVLRDKKKIPLKAKPE
jgi:hypothetical protein